MCLIHDGLPTPPVLIEAIPDGGPRLWARLAGPGKNRHMILLHPEEQATLFCCRRRAARVLREFGPGFPGTHFFIHDHDRHVAGQP